VYSFAVDALLTICDYVPASTNIQGASAMKKPKATTTKRITHNGVTIREVRPGYYMIDVFRQGRRQRECFTDLKDAKTAADQLSIAIKNDGASVLDLTPEQRADAAKAIRLADGAATLTSAVEFWLRHNGMTGGVIMSELHRRWIVALRGQGCRNTTIAEREQKMTRLCKDMGARPVASITRDDLIQWFDAYQLKGATRDGYRRCYRACFQYAVEERMIEFNPVAAIKAIRMDERLPTPFTVKQVEAILTTAAAHAPIMVPTLAVQFFAGLRPGEAMGLDWASVDFAERLIRITPETSKVRRTRIIEMNDACYAWLSRYRKPIGPLGIRSQSQFGFYMHRKDCKGATGLIGAAGVKWIQDGPRKTFASMHYATHGDAAKLASMLGHSGGHDILFRHYRGLVKKSEAITYWKITPKSKKKNNTIRFKGAA
jgi:integrase